LLGSTTYTIVCVLPDGPTSAAFEHDFPQPRGATFTVPSNLNRRSRQQYPDQFSLDCGNGNRRLDHPVSDRTLPHFRLQQFVQVNTSTATTFNDTAGAFDQLQLSASGSDGTNFSGYSNTTTAATRSYTNGAFRPTATAAGPVQ